MRRLILILALAFWPQPAQAECAMVVVWPIWEAGTLAYVCTDHAGSWTFYDGYGNVGVHCELEDRIRCAHERELPG